MADVSVEPAVLPVELPHGDPVALRAVARQLHGAAGRLRSTARRGTSLLNDRWTGEGADAAARRAARLSLRLHLEADRCEQAADALIHYVLRLEVALRLAEEARRLLAVAETTQHRADAAHPTRLLERQLLWRAARPIDRFADPEAQRLARRAQAAALHADDVATGAAHRVVAVLSQLAGVSVAHRGISPRAVVDLAGFVPVAGDAIDLANGAVYLAQGEFGDAALSVGAAVPGPSGWGAGAGRVGRTVREADAIIVAARKDGVDLEDFRNILRHRETLLAMARASADQAHRPLHLSPTQLRDKYKHAGAMFGLPANFNAARGEELAGQLRAFVSSPKTVRIDGTFRGQPAIIYMDSERMQRMVLAHPDGAFWTTWPLPRVKAANVWARHRM